MIPDSCSKIFGVYASKFVENGLAKISNTDLASKKYHGINPD